MSSSFRVSIDIGGTFTDSRSSRQDGSVTIGKAPSTPARLLAGFIDAVAAAARALGLELPELLERTSRMSHGTTVGINAVVSRTGRASGLISTAGPRGRAADPQQHGQHQRPAGRADPQLRGQLTARAFRPAGGRTLRRCRNGSTRSATSSCRSTSARSRRRRPAAGPGRRDARGQLPVEPPQPGARRSAPASCSTSAPRPLRQLRLQLAQRIGEYPRAATAVMNSYIGPLMRDYVTRLLDELASPGYATACCSPSATAA